MNLILQLFTRPILVRTESGTSNHAYIGILFHQIPHVPRLQLVPAIRLSRVYLARARLVVCKIGEAVPLLRSPGCFGGMSHAGADCQIFRPVKRHDGGTASTEWRLTSGEARSVPLGS